MKNNRILTIGGMIFLSTCFYSAIRLSQLPEQVPMHFDMHGQVDRYGSKWEGVLFGPIMMLVLLLIFAFIPKFMPKEKRLDSFQKAWDMVCITIMGFMAFVHFLILNPGAANNGEGITKLMMIGMSILFIVLGNLMGKTERNYVMGIRTPWTLESDEVWKRTHRLGGQLMVGGGLVSLVLALLGANVLVIVAVILVVSLYPVFYSYMLYKKLNP